MDKKRFAPYSYSKISLHKQCPRKFKNRHILKIPTEKRDMTALWKGRAIHNILENHPKKSNHKLAPKYQPIADNFIGSKKGQEIFSSNSVREMSFGLTESLEITDYNSKDAIFRGFIDLIYVSKDEVVIGDYKTGKYREEKWQDYEQLMFYSIFVFRKYINIKRIKLEYIYVEHENSINEIVLERTYLPKYENDLLMSINDIENDHCFEKSKSALCNYCEYQKYCESDE